MEVICEACKSKIEVECFVYGQRIQTTHNVLTDQKIYTAIANVRFFCPECGRLHDYMGVEKELSIDEIGAKVKSVIPYFIEKRLKAMDTTAATICMENDIPVLAFGLFEDNALLRAVNGEKIGTIIKN